jgi:hypothetical protein
MARGGVVAAGAAEDGLEAAGEVTGDVGFTTVCCAATAMVGRRQVKATTRRARCGVREVCGMRSFFRGAF